MFPAGTDSPLYVVSDSASAVYYIDPRQGLGIIVAYLTLRSSGERAKVDRMVAQVRQHANKAA
jgi:hypothetical protein